ncbi:glycosyltransferase family 2 protein [Patescibacteria group bacterium]|nr:glycosyltransferase family 2 protein [Patescibacteria group bacterium]
MKKLILILPTFNEGPVIGQVLTDLEATVKKLPVKTKIIVINDGSTDSTASIVKKSKTTLLTHRLNRGLGASISTGLKYAKLNQADFAITMDSDGQHDPDDIKTILEPLLNNKADIVIGSRMLESNNPMPLYRKVFNQISNLITKVLFGVYSTDSLSGFRGFSKKAINKIELKTERMEVSNELFLQIKKHQLKYIDVPIKVIYTAYSIKKGQKASNAFAIIFKLLLRLFR